MRPIPPSHERSVRRSRVRLQVLLAVSSLGEAYIGQVSRLTGIPWPRVKWALLGHPPQYRVELSLVGVGLVREKITPAGTVFAITSAGRRKARSITQALARRGSTRERVAAHVQVTGHLRDRAAAGDRSPAP